MADYKTVLADLKKQYLVLQEEAREADEKRKGRDQKMYMLKNAIDGLEGLLNPKDNGEKVDVQNAIITESRENNATFHYPADKTWEERIKTYMKYKNVPLKISHLLEEFKKYEPDYSISQLKGALNNTIQSMNKKDALKIYNPPRKEKGFYYGNPLWFEGDKLKEEHIPNTNKKSTW